MLREDGNVLRSGGSLGGGKLTHRENELGERTGRRGCGNADQT